MAVYIQKSITVILLACMVVIIGLQVFFRYFLNTPLSWTEELARLLQIWLTFMIIGLVLGSRDHIVISYFVERIPTEIRIFLRSFIDFGILIFSVILIKWGIELAILEFPSRSTALDIPLSYFSIPFCCSSLFVLVHTIDLLMTDISEIGSVLSKRVK